MEPISLASSLAGLMSLVDSPLTGLLFDLSRWKKVSFEAEHIHRGIFRWKPGPAPAAAGGEVAKDAEDMNTGGGTNQTPDAQVPTTPEQSIAGSANTNTDQGNDDESVVNPSPDSNTHDIEIIIRTETDHEPAYSINGNGFVALASLWNPHLPRTSPTTGMYHIPRGQPSHTKRWGLLLGNKSILKFKQSLVLQVDAVNTTQICVIFGVKQKNCPRAERTAIEWLDDYQVRFASLQSVFLPFIKAAPTITVLKQLFLLRIYWVNLIQASSFFDMIETEYSAASIQERLPKLDGGFVRDIVAETITLDEFSRCTVELSEALNGLLGVLEPILGSTTTQQEFRCLAAELRSSCYSFTVKVDRLKALLDQRVRYGELLYNLQDSTSTWLLTLLAAIFLPLSLAAGILSIQTRFNSLGPLLYDFVGVAILLTAIALVVGVTIYLALNVASFLKRLQRRSRFVKLARIFQMGLHPFIFAILGLNFLLIWSLVVASFLVGMLMNIDLGWRVLGYGLAAWIGIYILAAMSPLVLGAMSSLIDALRRN